MDSRESQIRHLVDLYQKAERAILRQIQSLDALDDSEDKTKRITRIAELQKQTELELARLNKESRQWTKVAPESAYKSGVDVAQKEIKASTGKTVVGFGGFHVESVALMADTAYSRLADVITTAGRRTLDVYQEAKLSVHAFEAFAGTESVSKLTRRLRDEMLDKGIVGFVDKSGHNWNISTYAEMLARTTLLNARRDAQLNEFQLHGYDLVQVSEHHTDCDKCLPWEGAVLSISGNSKKYRSLDEAKAAGLFHPNCKHSVSGYFADEDDDIKDDATESAHDLSEEEEAALKRYVSSDAYKINEKLRRQEELSADEDRFVLALDGALEKIPVYKGDLYRNITFDMSSDEAYNRFVKEHQQGNVVLYPQFSSASKSKDGYLVDGEKIIHYVIESISGRDISGSGFGAEGEEEVMLQRNSRFKVVGVVAKGLELFLTVKQL